MRACYDEGEWCSETFFFDYCRYHAIEIKILRIFNTYGPRLLPCDGGFVSNFVVQAFKDGDISIYGECSQTRSFCYVDAMVNAIIRIMKTPGALRAP